MLSRLLLNSKSNFWVPGVKLSKICFFFLAISQMSKYVKFEIWLSKRVYDVFGSWFWAQTLVGQCLVLRANSLCPISNHSAFHCHEIHIIYIYMLNWRSWIFGYKSGDLTSWLTIVWPKNSREVGFYRKGEKFLVSFVGNDGHWSEELGMLSQKIPKLAWKNSPYMARICEKWRQWR